MPTFKQNGSRSQTTAGQRVVLLDLLTDSHEVTLAQNNYRTRTLGEVLVDVGPRLEGITIHYRLADRTANFSFKVGASWSMDGNSWLTYDLVGPINVDGQGISSEYTDKTKFGRLLRFEFATTDGGAVEHGMVSVMAALRFYQGA